MALRWRNAPPGAKMMTILVIMIPAISLCVMIYFILKQFVLSKDECKKHSDCNKTEYCKYSSLHKHNICEACCIGRTFNKGGACEQCKGDDQKVGVTCPTHTCTKA